MKILFDHNMPRRLRKHLLGHSINTTREMGWDRLENGELMAAAKDAGFDVFLSIDKKLEHEHNLSKLVLPIVVVDALSNSLEYLAPFAPAVLALCDTAPTPALYIISLDGSVQRLTSPR